MSENDRRAVVEYIANMSEELALLAEGERIDMGAYLLRMASLEFRIQCDRLAPSPAAEKAG